MDSVQDQTLPRTISGLNNLPFQAKSELYQRLIPTEIIARFNLPDNLIDDTGRDLIVIKGDEGQSDAELFVYHEAGFIDPVLYGHITDTLIGQIHILLYVLNDPISPRFNIDRMPDGTPTLLGAVSRNLEEEVRAMQAGVSPGQVRQGLHLMQAAVLKFEEFVQELGHTIYFVEPLYYHNAVIFERFGFSYQKGRKLMEEINAGFQPRGRLTRLLDSSTPFRQFSARSSIRKRSWAIHDGILGMPFSGVTMYKRAGIMAGLNTSKNCAW